MPIMPNGCYCNLAPDRAHRNKFDRPTGPKPLSLPMTTFLLGAILGFILGILFHVGLRYVIS